MSAYALSAFGYAGKISEQEVIVQFITLLVAGLGAAYVLDQWAGHEQPIMLILAVLGSIVSYIYSAPPLKLKQSGWIGNYALGSSYIALPWWAGQVSSSRVIFCRVWGLGVGGCMGLGLTASLVAPG